MSNEPRGTQPTLLGSRVLLRPWILADADEVFVACQDPEIQRWTTVPNPYTKAHADEYVAVTAPQTWSDGGALFAVVDEESNDLLASMGAHRVRDGVAEVGYWTRREARRRGLTTDALRTLTQWLFTEAGVARTELVIEPTNAASIGLARSAGFLQEGLLRQRFLLRGQRVDGLIFSRLPTDSPA